MRRALVFTSSLSALLLAADPPPGQKAAPAPGEVKLAAVTYDQLAEAVRSLRGKVVVVDAWATYCVPCMKEFPNLVRLERTYAQDGLVCISVSVDSPKRQDAALKFLQRQKAAFANYLLTEDPPVWPDRWNVKGVPVVFVFDREGRRAAKFDNDEPHQFTYEDVEALVKKLLAAQP
jgi:thiol-disulfide isomerase/thioredoxin